MIEKKRTFGVIDTDRSPKLIEQGDYVAALNIRNSASTGNQTGVIENVKGNELFQFNLPPGLNECIGAYSHEEENYVYYFVWNQNNDHQIIRFNYDQESFEVVLRTPELKFDRANQIVEAQIIGDQLFFNDAKNEVRRIDIEECLNYNEPEDIWEFTDTIVVGGVVTLEGNTPPPFAVGDQITVIRNWRDAWIDYEEGVLGESGALALQHKYDPNPAYSGLQEVVQVVGTSVVLAVPATGVQDELTLDVNGVEQSSFISGRAYLYDSQRKFNAPFKEDFIKLYRANPPFNCHARYGSDESVKTNNIRGNLYQFKTRYVYANGMRSVTSPICRTPLPVFELNIPFQNLPTSWDNYIGVFFDTGGDDVVEIELMCKNIGENSEWAVVKTVRKETEEVVSNSSYEYRFFGTEVMVSVPVAEGIQPMDYIPHVAQAFCFIRDKRNAVGGLDEGFDHVNINAKLRPLDLASSAAVLFEITIDDQSTLNNLPVSELVRWPLNRFNNDGGLGYFVANGLFAGYNGDGFPAFYAASKSSQFSSPTLEVFSFSENSQFTLEFSQGWQEKVQPAPYIDEGNGWSRVDFGIIQGGGDYGDFSVPGAVAILRVEYLVSKALVWRQQQGSSDPIVPTNTFVYQTSNPLTDEYLAAGVASYNNFTDDPEDPYWRISDTFVKNIEEGETAEDVRDFFLNEILNGDNGLHTERSIVLSSYTNDDVSDNYGWLSKRLDVTLYMEAEEINGLPAGQSAMRVRPRVDVPAFNTSDNGLSAFIGVVSLNRLREWFRVLGINRNTTRAQVVNTDGDRGFKTGASHPVAIEYRDSVGRRATLSPAEVVYVPYFNEGSLLNSSPYSVAILARIYSTAPSWATHYQFYYAGNASMLKWITFEVNWIDSSEEGVKIALTQRLTRYNNSNNLGGATSLSDPTGRSNLSYSWTRGDRLRFLSYWQGDQIATGTESQDVPAEQYVDVEVIGEATDNSENPAGFAPFGLVIIVSKESIAPYINVETFGSGSLVEVYTPRDVAPEDLTVYREIGECFEVTDGQHWGNRLNQGTGTPGANSSFAEILIKNNGDAYAIGRKKLPGVTRSKDRLVESSSFSDFYPSFGWGPGAANRIDFNARRTLRKELIRYSDFLLRSANGLNRYFDGNLSDEPDVTHGLIQRMECPETNLHVFQELSVGVMPIRALELMSATGDNILMRSDNVIGNISYVPGSIGIGGQREALCYFLGRFYWPSIANGKFFALSGTSVDTISAYKREAFWNEVSALIKKSNSRVRIQTEYDPAMDELIVHIPNIFDGLPAQGESPVFNKRTLAFSSKKKGWTTEYSYHPDVMLRHNNKLLSWKNGQLYVHDETEEWNQYYEGEVAQRSRITLSFNSEIDAVKFFQAIIFESTTEPDEVEITTDYGSGQVTGLLKSANDFRYSENQYSAAILRDENSPGGILSGDVIRGENCLVTVEFDPTNMFKLFSVNLRSQRSEMTDR